MKRNLLLTLAAAASLSLSAQSTHPTYQGEKSNLVPVEAVTSGATISRAAATVTNDTAGIANAKWGITYGMGGTQGQASIYNLRAAATQTGGVDYLSALQYFPMVGEMEMSAVGFFGAGSMHGDADTVDIFVTDGDGIKGVGSFEMPAGFSTHWFEFDSTFALTDTFAIWVQPHSDADTITIITSGRSDTLGFNDYNGLLNVLSFDDQQAFAGQQNYSIEAGDADWQVYPVLSYEFETSATSDIQCLSDNELTATFDISGNEGLIHNHIFNINDFYMEIYGIGAAEGYFYATADYATEQDADTLDTEETDFEYTFSAAADNNITFTETFRSFGFLTRAEYTSSADFLLEACTATSIEEETVSIVWNQADAMLMFSSPMNALVNVYSVDGKLVKTLNANNQSFVQLSDLTTGIYVVELIENNERSVLKISK